MAEILREHSDSLVALKTAAVKRHAAAAISPTGREKKAIAATRGKIPTASKLKRALYSAAPIPVPIFEYHFCS
ncbi:hypothetical protein [Rickettsiella endosymbiont of Dermanyssus gallinae]|uniref:hypothetical protein n=1 Tax=Rickettsiella endosymbiont of Dermanyssus gallinae TaxID=2856608 RepID=UPI001C52F33F|nr:hypothetical protein [Rickettsiella endosymbiont of Dermanyssus gallinae]